MKKLAFLSLIGIVAAATMIFSAVDTQACCVYRVYPIIEVIDVDPDVLWPPNHKMVEILLDVKGQNIASWWVSGVSVVNVGSGEGDPGNDPDFEYTGKILRLRAERSGEAGAREYVVTITAISGDRYGTTTSTPVSIIVPHDLKGGQGRVLAPGQQ